MHVKVAIHDLERRTPQGNTSCGGSHFSQLIRLQSYHTSMPPHCSMTAATMSGGTMHVAVPVQHLGVAKDQGATTV